MLEFQSQRYILTIFLLTKCIYSIHCDSSYNVVCLFSEYALQHKNVGEHLSLFSVIQCSSYTYCICIWILRFNICLVFILAKTKNTNTRARVYMFFLSVIQSFHILLLNCIFHYSSLRYTSNKSLIRYKFHLFSRTMKEYGHRLFDILNLNRILNFHWFYLFLLPKSKTNWLCVFHSIQFYSISNEIVWRENW